MAANKVAHRGDLLRVVKAVTSLVAATAADRVAATAARRVATVAASSGKDLDDTLCGPVIFIQPNTTMLYEGTRATRDGLG